MNVPHSTSTIAPQKHRVKRNSLFINQSVGHFNCRLNEFSVP